VLPLRDLGALHDGAWLKTAGMVIVRQRPGTAKGFCFLTLEDETGTGNAVLTPDYYKQFRTILHTSPLLVVEGRLQRQEGVTHLRVRRIEPLAAPGPTPPSHDFR
jgi:error-prone DNA polymerase